MRPDRIADRPLGRRGEVTAEGNLLLDGAVCDLDRLDIRDPGERLLRNRKFDPDSASSLLQVFATVS